jgi:hypothetical protein
MKNKGHEYTEFKLVKKQSITGFDRTELINVDETIVHGTMQVGTRV